MAPSPRRTSDFDSQGEAGLHTAVAGNRARGRKYISVVDTIGEHKTLEPGEHTLTRSLSSLSQERTPRTRDDFCGLSSGDLAGMSSGVLGRGRRHITHGMSTTIQNMTPSNLSVASEPISEDSVSEHLGHRVSVRDERWKELLQAEAEHGLYQEEEPTGGVASHHLSKKHHLGAGRKHLHPRGGIHIAKSICDPGGEDVFDNPKGSFLGKMKKRLEHGRPDAADHFEDGPKKDKPAKRQFEEHKDVAVHASEDVPLGSSRQIDLHTSGFMGKRKGSGFAKGAQISDNPTLDRSAEPRDDYDISGYGLDQRGKRKFLVQNNLDSSCRHNMSRPEPKSAPTFGTRSASTPILERDLPANATPYYQDDLHPSRHAIKQELVGACRGSTEKERKLPNRQGKPSLDSTWASITWSPRKVDQHTASSFIEGEDSMQLITDEDHRENEFRHTLGKTKRSFGNAHNKSSLRFEYGDGPQYKTEHTTIEGIRWGNGHGKKKFEVSDHLDNATDGIEVYLSQNGSPLGRSKRKPIQDNLGSGFQTAPNDNVFMGPDGKYHPNRTCNPIRDNITGLMDHDAQSEDSNTFAVTGMRRKSEIIRPQSARRFPQKDFERVTPRSATPRARSEAPKHIKDRGLWKR